MLTREESETLLRSQVALQNAVLIVLDEVKFLRQQVAELTRFDCPPGVRAAVQLTAALPDYMAGLVVDQFELIHQSVLDRIKHEQGNVHVPAPAVES